MANNVCGLVVTYHPDPEVLLNLRHLRPQVAHLVVVDNGSSAAELAPLRAAAGEFGFNLIENGENLGIATALNIGIRRAIALGMPWVLMFDQDSQVDASFTATMVRAFEDRAQARPLGILIPRYVDKRLGNDMDAILEKDGTIETAMTSGTLMRTETFTRLGMFVDELFIDGVDHELSLRVRAAGMTIEECREAVLLHSPGTPSVHRHRLRAKPFVSSNYSPIRRYYQERNKIWLVRRYWRRFPDFCRRQYSVSGKDLVKIAFFEQDSLPKLRYFFLGVWHGLTGKTGKLKS